MKQFAFSLIFVFSMGTLFAQSAALDAAAQDDSIVRRPCPDKKGKCFYRKEKLNGKKVVFTLVEYDEAGGIFIEPNANNSNDINITTISFKIIEEPSINTKELKRKTKEKALKNKGKKAAKGLKKEIRS